MSDSHANWWMDASCRWHQGLPPPGWWQAHDGRWHPPALDDTTAEMGIDPPGGGAHLAAGGRATNLWETYRRWPRWARVAGPVAACILVIGVLGAAATEGLREGDPETTATERAATTERETTTTVSNVAPPPSTPTTTAGTPTTGSMPDTTAPAEPEPTPTTVEDPAPAPPPTPDPTSNDIHPGAPCSPVGATAISGDGVPMTCTTEKCHGAPYSLPRWRRTAC